MNPHIDRRTFLRTTAAAATVGAWHGSAPLAFAAETKTRPLIGSQLYGWGQSYSRAGRNAYENLDEIFSALRDAGYDYAEGNLNTANPEKNGEFADKLKTRGLQPVSLYTGGALHTENAEDTVASMLDAAQACRSAGFRIINCNPNPIGRDKTDEELKRQVRALKVFGEGLTALGMQLGIHHHTPAMRNGAREFHYNFTETRADTVGFCYDVHWVFRGGVQPMNALKDYGDRVVSWHLRQSRDGIWWEDLATGDIDYRGVATFARENGLPPFYTVELAIEDGTKITRGVVENHARSLKFVREVFVA